jgi:hypothetical protein
MFLPLILKTKSQSNYFCGWFLISAQLKCSFVAVNELQLSSVGESLLDICAHNCVVMIQ